MAVIVEQFHEIEHFHEIDRVLCSLAIDVKDTPFSSNLKPMNVDIYSKNGFLLYTFLRKTKQTIS